MTFGLVFLGVAIAIAMLIVRIGAVALEMSGMDSQAARFQALSAFTGTGFTTRDSENVVRHPPRRKIVSWLIILGNAGMISVIASLIQTFKVTPELQDAALRIAGVGLCLLILYRFVAAKRVAAFIDRTLKSQISQRTNLEPLEVEEILSQKKGWGIFRLEVWRGAPCVNKTLADATFRDHGILVLAVERGDEITPAPTGRHVLHAGDRLLCYGQLSEMEKLITRSSAWVHDTWEMWRTPWGGAGTEGTAGDYEIRRLGD